MSVVHVGSIPSPGNVTSNDAAISYATKIEQWKAAYSTLKADEKATKEKQIEILGSYKPCVSYSSPSSDNSLQRIQDLPWIREAKENQSIISKTIKDNLSGLNPKRLSSLISHNFSNPEVMRTMACIADSILYGIDDGKTADYATIHEWFTKLKQIGADSAEGYAMNGLFGVKSYRTDQIANLFIIKTAQNPENDNLFHELFVAVKGTNLLRASVPNFAYVYGGVKCSPAWIAMDKKVASWCDANLFNKIPNQVTYLIYENIYPAKSFREELHSMDPGKFLNYYMQVLFALKAGERIGFTHYDLHTDNVLLRKHVDNKVMSIPYEVDGKTEYLTTDAVSTIIDYGLGHIVYDNKHYGVYDRIAYSILPHVTFPIFDAYKLLLFAARELAKDAAGNNVTSISQNSIEVFEVISQIFLYFNRQEPLINVIDLQYDQRYSLPYNQVSMQMTISGLISYIRSIFPCKFITSAPAAGAISLSHAHDTLTIDSAIEKVGLLHPAPKTLFELHDAVASKAAGYKVNYQLIIKNTDDKLAEFAKLIKETEDKHYNIDMSNAEIVIRDATMIKYRQILDSVANVFNNYTHYQAMLKVMNANKSPELKDKLPEWIKTLTAQLQWCKTYLDKWKKEIEQDNAKLDKIVETPLFKEALQANHKLLWYVDGRKKFMFL